MKAMVLESSAPVESSPLVLRDVPIPVPQKSEILVRVEVCGVCRTDLHVVEGDLPTHKCNVIPGHEIVGRVKSIGPGSTRFQIGDKVGIAWLHKSCGQCDYCRRGDENLCNAPTFTGYDVDGGFAEYVTVPEAFTYPIPETIPSLNAAPLLCAGIIGYRALCRSDVGPGQSLGLYGFGASAHIVTQIAQYWQCPVYVCTRGKDHQAFARKLGAEWVGSSEAIPPTRLHSSILFAPAGELVPVALSALDKGGTLALAGIYMTPIPTLDYTTMVFNEHNLRSVTANTRVDGSELLKLAEEIPIQTHTQEYPLEQANEALQDVKQDRVNGAAVLRIQA